MTSFELKAYSQRPPQLSVYGSEDGSTWAPIVLASTNPAPAVGGRQMLSELLPAGSLPAGVNRIKLVLGRGTEIAQVDIMGGRSGPACLARTPAARANSLAGFLPGTSPAGVLGSIGVPGARSRLVWRYCVTGGGQFAVVFPRHGGVSMIATTARGYRLDGIGPGSSLASLHRRYGITGLRAVGSRLLVTPGGQRLRCPFRTCDGGGTRRPIGASQAGCTAGRRQAGRTGAACGVLITQQASDVSLPTDWVRADRDHRTADLVPATEENQRAAFAPLASALERDEQPRGTVIARTVGFGTRTVLDSRREARAEPDAAFTASPHLQPS